MRHVRVLLDRPINLARGLVYVISADGWLHALSLSTGTEARGWPVAVAAARDRVEYVWGGLRSCRDGSTWASPRTATPRRRTALRLHEHSPGRQILRSRDRPHLPARRVARDAGSRPRLGDRPYLDCSYHRPVWLRRVVVP